MKLQDLGLSQYESKAYETLIKFGRTTASKISRESGVPYSRIYDVLESLVHKGLVRIMPGETKEFVPSDPNILLELAENRRKELDSTIEEIKSMKKTYELGVKEPVVLAYGKKNFYTITHELINAQEYTYSIRYISEPKPMWIQGHKKFKKIGVESKDMARYDDETRSNVQKWLKSTKERWKYINNEGIALSIVDDKEVMISLIKSNVTMIVRDTPFAKIMKQLYLSLWEKSPEIKREN